MDAIHITDLETAINHWRSLATGNTCVLSPELAALAEDIASGIPYDLMGVRLETAAGLVADITGETTPDDVLNAVFDRFCIGK